MSNQEIVNYIGQSRMKGIPDAQIRQSLAQSGWSQDQINEAFGVPRTGNTAPVPPAPTPAIAGMATGTFFDQKTKEVVMWSVIGYFARSIISTIGGIIIAQMFYSRYGYNFNIGSMVISSIIYGGIFGVILAKFYGKVQEINRRYFGGWFNSLYRLIFYPSLIGGILALLFAGGLSFSLFGNTALGGYLFMSTALSVIAAIIGSFIYAKIMVSKVGRYFS